MEFLGGQPTMKNRYFAYGLTTAAMLAMVLLMFVSSPRAQRANPRTAVKAAMPTPKMADGHPDFTGFWLNGAGGLADYGGTEGNSDDGNFTRLPDGSTLWLYDGAQAGIPNAGKVDTSVPETAPPYKPEYMAKVQTLVDSEYGGNTSSPYDPMNDCKPNGVPRSGISGTHIIMNPSGVAVLYENDPGPVYRIIYTDGRQHPKDLDTSYMGNSIGHWEGDTLVIDTVGLNDETWLGGAKFQNYHSDKLHVVERWSRQGDVMSRSVVAEDPVMFTKPWVQPAQNTTLGNKDDYIQPQMCRTNDKAHLILQTPDNQWRCNWCQVDADKIYGQGAAAENKANAKGGRGGGGDE
jgi:hypothetical protein